LPLEGGPAALFADPVDDVWLEIGFGAGEHLLWQAERHPHVGLIGCEPFLNGVVKVLSEIERLKLCNIRIYADDARWIIDWLPDASIGRVFLLFPDPWPKKRHRKRRLVSEATLRQLGRISRRGAELRIATDDGEYARAILLAFSRQGTFAWTAARAADWRQRPFDWPQTRYEQKAIAEGRRRYYLSFRRL
jgi:tRNA (guanine-N7-)-methyltransferase